MSIIIQHNIIHHISINTKERTIFSDGKIYKIPKKIKGNNVTQINGRIYIDGYEFINGKFKRTIKALFHLFF